MIDRARLRLTRSRPRRPRRLVEQELRGVVVIHVPGVRHTFQTLISVERSVRSINRNLKISIARALQGAVDGIEEFRG